MDCRAVGLAVLLLGSLLVPLGSVGAAADSENRTTAALAQQPDVGANEVVVRTTFSLEDTGEDEVRVRKEYFIGEEVSFLSRAFPYDIDDVSTRHMRRDGDFFHWTESGPVASVEYVANASVFGVSLGTGYSPGQREGNFAFLELGSRGPSHDATTERTQLAVAGEGYASSNHVVLGPHETHTRTVDDRRVTLVVPENVDLGPAPEAVLDALAETERRLDAAGGNRPSVSAFAVPTRGVVGYASGGDVVVDNTAPMAGTWQHEYVHATKQQYSPDDSARWVVEADAEYYGALYAFRRGDLTFRQFRSQLTGTSQHESERLTDPETWLTNPWYRTEYTRGALVVATLDAAIRNATAGERSYEDVFRRTNAHEGRLTHEAFRRIVVDVGGPSVGPLVDRYVAGTADPPIPDNPYAFTDPSLNTSLSVDKPHEDDMRGLHPGQRARLRLSVSNDGTDPSAAVGFSTDLPDHWQFLSSYGVTSGPNANTGYLQIPTNDSTTATLLIRLPENAPVGQYNYSVTARDVGGSTATLSGVATVVNESASDDSESDDSATNETLAPTVNASITLENVSSDYQHAVATELDDTTVLVQRDRQIDFRFAVEGTNHSVEGIGLVTEMSEWSDDGRFSDRFSDNRTLTVRARFTDGSTVERDYRIQVVPALDPAIAYDRSELYGDRMTARIGTATTLRAISLNRPEYDGHEIAWFVDGQRVATGQRFDYEFTDGEQNVTVVVRDGTGFTATETKRFRGQTTAEEGLERARGVPIALYAIAVAILVGLGLFVRAARS